MGWVDTIENLTPPILVSFNDENCMWIKVRGFLFCWRNTCPAKEWGTYVALVIAFFVQNHVLDRNHLPWNCRARFWTKAEVPSFVSSVPAARAKYFASSFRPEVRSV